MNRRTLLQLMGASVTSSLLAGCSAPNKTDTPNTTQTQTNEPTQDTPSDIKTATYSPTIRDGDEDFPLEYSVETVSGGYSSEESPLTITVTLTNPTDTTYFFGDSRQALFFLQNSEGKHPYRLFPNDEDTAQSFQFHTKCWIATQFYGMSQRYVYEELPPGESTSQSLVLAVSNQSYCPSPPDKIEFTTDIRLSESAWSDTRVVYQPTLQFQKEP